MGLLLTFGVCAQDSTAAGKVKLKFNDPQTHWRVSGMYINGKRHGTFESRDSAGSVVLREHFDHGRSDWAVYYKNGKWMMTRNKKGKIVKRAACGC